MLYQTPAAPPLLSTAPLPYPTSCLLGRSGCLEEGGTSRPRPNWQGLHGGVGSDGPAPNTWAGHDFACYKYGLHVKRSRREGQPSPPASRNTSDTHTAFPAFRSDLPFHLSCSSSRYKKQIFWACFTVVTHYSPHTRSALISARVTSDPAMSEQTPGVLLPYLHICARVRAFRATSEYWFRCGRMEQLQATQER